MSNHQPSNRETSITRPAHESTLERPDFRNSSDIAESRPVTTRQTLEGLQQTRDRLAAQRDDLNERLAVIDAAMQEVRQTGDTVAPTLRGGERRGRLVDAIDAILRAERPMHRQDILARLEEQGVYVGGNSPINSLSAYLSQDARFVSIGRGQWRLADEPETDETPDTEEGPDS